MTRRASEPFCGGFVLGVLIGAALYGLARRSGVTEPDAPPAPLDDHGPDPADEPTERIPRDVRDGAIARRL